MLSACSPQKSGSKSLKLWETAALWNAANFRCRQAFLKGEPVPSYGTLCAEFQPHPAFKALPSDIAQAVLKKLRNAWDSFFACLRLWKKGKLEKRPGLPGYWKDRPGKRSMRLIPVKSPRSYSLDAKTLALPLPADLRNGNSRLASCVSTVPQKPWNSGTTG